MGHVPVDAEWYIAQLVMEIIVGGSRQNVVHRNLVLIRAHSPDEAYEKALRFGGGGETSYKNPNGQPVDIRFRGVGMLEAMYEPLEDGSELTFEEHIGVSPEQINRWVRPKEQLQAFVAPTPGRDHDPDYRSAAVMETAVKMLERSGSSE